jgi:hypothetical protein
MDLLCINFYTGANSEYVEDLFIVVLNIYSLYVSRIRYSASEAVNLCSTYVEKSTKYSEQKYASYFRERNQLPSNLRVCKFFPTFTSTSYSNVIFWNELCEILLSSKQTRQNITDRIQISSTCSLVRTFFGSLKGQ